jgi:cytochrome P450
MLVNPLRHHVGERLGFPVAPGGFPLVGHMPVLATDTLGFLRYCAERVGPYFWLDLGFGKTQLMCLGQEAFAIFKNKHTTSTYLKAAIPEFIGESVIAQDGPVHHHMRTAMNGPFLPRGLTATGIGAVFAELIEQRVSTWPQQGELCILKETRELVLAAIFRLLGVAETELGEWRRQYERFMLLVVNLPIDFPGSPRRRGRKARSWLNDRLFGFIQTARAQPGAPGFLSALVHGRDEGGVALSDSELLDNLRLLVLAGHETSASTMAWMVVMLARHRDVWDSLCREACAADAVPCSPKELKRFPYAEAVFRETLRLYPPVVNDGRQSLVSFELGERTIPAGIQVAMSIMHLSRDKALYPDPDHFKPQRWLDKDEAISPIELAQFGGGPHFCLGYHLAWMEIVQFAVALARTLHPRALRPVLVGPPPVMRYLPLLHPAAAARVAFAPSP